MTDDFIQKLMLSKKIMDRHKEIPRGSTQGMSTTDYGESIPGTPIVEDYAPIPAKFNIPEEFGQQRPSTSVTPPKGNTKERILSSKLPDNIKKLMIENPIAQPTQQAGPVLSDDLVEKASRLMKQNGQQVIREEKQVKNLMPVESNQNLKSMIKETIIEIFEENGLLIDNSKNSNDLFSFRVGQHVFEGKVTKIKKVK